MFATYNFFCCDMKTSHMVRHDEHGNFAVLDVLRKIYNINSNHASALLSLVQNNNKELIVNKKRLFEFGKITPIADCDTIIKIIEVCPQLRKRDNRQRVLKTRHLLEKFTRKKTVVAT